MASRSQLHANRANAQHSTGPVTPAGKAASSANSVKHGLSSGFRILPDEDPDAFEDLLERITLEVQPRDEHETFLVTVMAQSRWKLDRIGRIEADLFERSLNGENVDARLALMLRYTTATERSYYKAEREIHDHRLRSLKLAKAEAEAPAPDPNTLTMADLERLTRPPIPAEDIMASYYKSQNDHS